MAQEVLIMKEETVSKLKNVIVRERFVNCYSREFSPESQEELEQFLLKLKETYKKTYLEIDIKEFENCENEKQETKVLLELINRELTGKGLQSVQIKAISIPNALHKWSNDLDGQALLVFYSFHDRYSEKEKNILRSLRKALRDKNEISSYLGILIVSNRQVFKWELFPESNLDERHVVFFDLESIAVG
jgi:hypothetical protein